VRLAFKEAFSLRWLSRDSCQVTREEPEEQERRQHIAMSREICLVGLTSSIYRWNAAAGSRREIHPPFGECGIRAAATLPSLRRRCRNSRVATRHRRVCCTWVRRRVSTAPLSTVAAVADRDEIDATGSGTESHAPRTVPFSVSLSRLAILLTFKRERNARLFQIFRTETKRMSEC